MRPMTLLGTIFKRTDGLLDSRIISPRQRPDRRIVGTSGSQGYARKRPALVPLEHLLLTGPHEVYDIDGNEVKPTKEQRAAYKNRKAPKPTTGKRRPNRTYIGRVVRRSDGRFEWNVTSRNGNLVHTSHSQGFERAGKLRADGTPTPGTALASLVLVCQGGPHAVDATVLPE